MYKFQHSTELMKNQKAAQVMSAQSLFDVLQSSSGQALFFSIGDDGMFRLSAEQDAVKTGWTPIDLTTELARNFTGKTVTAKTFAVSQNTSAGTIIIAQAVHVAEDDVDHLYLLTDLSDAPDAAWLQSSSGRSWMARPYDNTTDPIASLNIAYVNIAPGNGNAAPWMIVGVRKPSTSVIQNYLVSLEPSPPAGPAWTVFQTAEDYERMLDMHTGKPSHSLYSGLYELYTRNENTSLTFTARKGLFNAPPSVTKLTPPTGASSMASLPVDANGNTSLYVAGTGGIWLYTPEEQTSFAKGTEILSDGLIDGVEFLEAHPADTQVVLWGRNGQGQVFYSRCAADRQAEPGSWSAPVVIQQGGAQLASMLNRQTQSNELYVHTEGQTLVKLTQDPVTTQWRSQSILLPALASSDVVERYTFTTHITVVDENNLRQANVSFPLTATSPCTVYLSDQYITLSDKESFQARSDLTGTVTIVQETQSLGAVCYHLVQGDGTVVNVNPMSGIIDRLSAVKSGSDLEKVQVSDEEGNTSQLLPPSVTEQQQAATAKSIVQFVQISSTMPQDGSLKSSGTPRRLDPAAFDPQTHRLWGMSFAEGDVRYFEGPEQMSGMGLTVAGGRLTLTAPGRMGDISDSIETLAGDAFRWAEQAVQDVVQFVVKAGSDVVDVFIQMGERWYHFVLQCMNDVLHGVQLVFAQIGVFIDKLVQWLGWIFNWPDILRTRSVIKNIFRQYAQHCGDNLEPWKQELSNAFDGLEDKLDAWAALPPLSSGTVIGFASASTPRPGQDSPQSHWAVHHFKSNLDGASTSFMPTVPGQSLEQSLSQLWQLVQSEESTFQRAFDDLETQVIDQLTTLSAGEIVRRMITIFLDVLLDTIRNILTALIDVLQAVLQAALEALDAPIDIPVLSWLYHRYTGDSLSMLDLACLIVAIPATIVYKFAKGSVPFPDDPTTTALIHAGDFATIQGLLGGNAGLRKPAPAGGVPTLGSAAEVVPVVFEILAYFATLGLIPLSAAKSRNPDSHTLAALYAVLYFPYVAPNIQFNQQQTWDVIMDETITGISVWKTVGDAVLCGDPWMSKASPYMELVINGAWQVPAVAGLVRSQDADSVIAFLGNTAFDLSGVMAPWAENQYVFLAILACMGIYGELQLVTATVS